MVSITFPGAICTTADDKEALKSAAYLSLGENENSIECLVDKSCRLVGVQVKEAHLFLKIVCALRLPQSLVTRLGVCVQNKTERKLDSLRVVL